MPRPEILYTSLFFFQLFGLMNALMNHLMNNFPAGGLLFPTVTMLIIFYICKPWMTGQRAPSGGKANIT